MSFGIEGKFKIAKFLRRGPRFVGFADIDGKEVRCHLPNPGRMKEFLTEGVDILLKINEGNSYKTRYTMVAVVKEIQNERLELINLNTHVPVKWLCTEFQETSPFGFFKNHRCIRKEPSYGNHRFDLLLEDQWHNEIICEIKSTTKIIDGVGYFPDAVSSRATNQLKTLYERAQKGGKSVVLFIVQSDEADLVRPDMETDPVFAETIKNLQHENLIHVAFTSTSYVESPDFNDLFAGKIIYQLKREIPVSLTDDRQI
ncbi:MAG: hypothetical protein D6732_11405 [Methanobacteriota archaeon]|nr:MAG: hypothetical protein D6732_11405 [Euryarchaeota archaeon]